MLQINFTIEGLDKIKFDLNAEPILDEAATLLLNRILNRYRAETDPDNKKWIPSAAGIRRRAQGGTGTLWDTGNLFRSIQVHKRGKDKREISTDVLYAEEHQLGTKGQVKRSFLGFNDEDLTLVKALVQLRVNELVK